MHNPTDAYMRDMVLVAREKLAKGQIDRRTFLRATAALGAVPVLGLQGAGSARAADGELVLVNFGGTQAEHVKKIYGPGCKDATGRELVVDGTGASPAKIKAMVDANDVVWDVCDYGPHLGFQLGGEYLEPIDYSIVAQDKIIPGFANEYGCAAYTFSWVLTYHKEMVSETPQNWVDFWDLDKFPGKRGMYKYAFGQIEAALMASGVAKEDLYPLDLDRAMAKIREIKDEIIWWDSGAQSQQLLRDKEVAMASLWHSRAVILRDENPGIDFNWQDAVLMVGGWAIPKNNPAGAETSNKFIASAQNPESQIEYFKVYRSGPANPETLPLIPDELRKDNPWEPVNAEKQVRLDPRYWGENYDKIQDKWFEAIS